MRTETERPRLLRMRPIEATLIPLPKELTTPPVTKINFVGISLHKNPWIDSGENQAGFEPESGRDLERIAEAAPTTGPERGKATGV